MTPDLAVVTLSPELAAALGAERVLVEAVELHGAAIVQGFAVHWIEQDGGYDVAAWRSVPEKHRAEIEHLFVEARRPVLVASYEEIRHSVPRAATWPSKPCAPVRYSPGRRTA